MFAALMGAGGQGDNSQAQTEMYKHSTPLHSVVSFNATAVAKVIWRLFPTDATAEQGRISGPDPRQELKADQHPAVKLWDKPNDRMHGQFFREYSQAILDLAGLAYWVVDRTNPFALPTSMWPVHRKNIMPIPDPNEYLLGYAYLPDDGTAAIPLRLDEVIPLQMVDPTDPLGGVAPAQPLMVDMQAARATAEFRENFFRNSANPGGIIEIQSEDGSLLSEPDFKILSERWAEQHRGVRNAHRVAIIERGKWIQNDTSLKDMQFVEMRSDDRDNVYEGYGTSKSLMGVMEDANRASVEANEYVWSKYRLVSRLDRFKNALDHFFLPMYQSSANGEFEFCYDNPVPKDWQADAFTFTSNVNGFVALVNAGAEWNAALAACSLPSIPQGPKPAAPTAPEPPQVQPPADSRDQRLTALLSSWGAL